MTTPFALSKCVEDQPVRTLYNIQSTLLTQQANKKGSYHFSEAILLVAIVTFDATRQADYVQENSPTKASPHFHQLFWISSLDEKVICFPSGIQCHLTPCQF